MTTLYGSSHCLALYSVGEVKSDKMLEAINLALPHLIAINVNPTHVHVRQGERKGKRLRLDTVEKRGWQVVLGKQPRSVALYRAPIDGDFRPLDRFDAAVNWYWSPKRREFVICVQDAFMDADPCTLLKLAASQQRLLAFEYGVMFRDNISHMPVAYALGVAQKRGEQGSDPLTKELEEAWVLTGSEALYRFGILRDVYEWNFLTAAQLDTDRFGRPLREWIGSAKGIGALEPITADMWCWRISEERLPEARRAMLAKGHLMKRDRLLDYMERVLGMAIGRPVAPGPPAQAERSTSENETDGTLRVDVRPNHAMLAELGVSEQYLRDMVLMAARHAAMVVNAGGEMPNIEDTPYQKGDRKLRLGDLGAIDVHVS